MRKILVLLLVLSVSGVATTQAQDVGPRSATLLAGFGNAMGWLGMQAEAYLGTGRYSVFGGLGYTPEVDTGDPSGITLAGGVRGYTGGVAHRGFLELSVSQLSIETGDASEEGSRNYGPGVQVGWQYTSRGGFTMMASAGLGYDGSDLLGQSAVVPMLGLGFGYTWRR